MNNQDWETFLHNYYAGMFHDLSIEDLEYYVRRNFGIFDCRYGLYAEDCFRLNHHAKYLSVMTNILIEDTSIKAQEAVKIIRVKLRSK